MDEYRLGGWDLGGLEGDMDEGLGELDALATRLEGFRNRLGPDMQEAEFREALQLVERIEQRGRVLQGYAHLRFSADTGDQAALALMGRLDSELARLHNRIIFFGLWWKALDEAPALRLMRGAGRFGYYLGFQRLFAPHVLTEPEERIVNLKDVNGVDALVKLYDMITSKFEFTLEADGEAMRLNRDALMMYARHPEPPVREAAYRELYRVYGAEEAVLGQMYVHRAMDWASEQILMRRHATPLAVRNLANDVPGEAVDALLDVCAEQAPVFHDYFRYKARVLGNEGTLRRFDLYAPVPGAPERTVPYDEAVRMVLDSLGAFSPLIRDHARGIVEAGHLDTEIRRGKRGGAFCMSVLPTMRPWILINYTGDPRQVATLAHELGHGIHSLMADGHSVLSFHPALPLAETASVFSEMLLTDRLLAEERDPLGRRSILMSLLDDIYATVMRQAHFVLFEREAHVAATVGARVDEISEMYLRGLRAQFGGSVEVDDIFRHEWLSIPHIYHTPFYCYAYSFGLLLSLSLYKRYKEEGAGFVPGYLRILSHGGSESPETILREAGVDMRDPGFWTGGFEVIKGLVRELKAI